VSDSSQGWGRGLGGGALLLLAGTLTGVCGGTPGGPRAAGAGSRVDVGMVAGVSSARPGASVQVKDVPFRATQVIVRRGPNGVVETRGRMARNSEGSMYVELIDQRTKRPTEVLIFDVPRHRELVLDTETRRYRVVPLPGLEGREVPIDYLPEQLRVARLEKDSSVREVRDGVELTWKGLGVRRVGGLETVGSVRMRRPMAAPGEAMDGPAEVDESWMSVDLGIAVLRTRHDPLKDEDTEVALTEILRAEPDAQMFEVPATFVLEGERMRGAGR